MKRTRYLALLDLLVKMTSGTLVRTMYLLRGAIFNKNYRTDKNPSFSLFFLTVLFGSILLCLPVIADFGVPTSQ